MTGAAMLLAVAGFGARAEGDNVITVVNGEVKIANNGQCSLVEAIRNANNQNNGQPHDDCAAGNPTGADTIVLPVNGVFTLTEENNTSYEYGPNGLPWLGSAITIDGSGSIIQRKDGVSDFRILSIGPKGNVSLKNLTIQNGSINHDDWFTPDHEGGGIFNQGEVVITGSRIVDNIAYSYWGCGGGIANHGKVTITSSVIQNNTSSGVRSSDGGGICNSGDGVVEVIDSLISGNMATAWRFYGNVAGGGISNGFGTLIISGSVISDNVGSNEYSVIGGGIFSSGKATITGSVFFNNKADASVYYGYFGEGGAIANNGDMTIANSTISDNEAHFFGAGIANFEYLSVINTTIANNIGSGIEATCASSFSETKILRSIISGNSVGEVILTDNTYCKGAGGIFADAHNVFGHGGNSGVAGFTPGPTDIIPSAPLNAIISLLADNGGPTWTHALPPGSPAIDRAPNNACTAAPVNGVDQRGFPRNRNGAGGASTTECDIGAFEFQPVEPTPTPTATALPTSTATPTATTPAEATQTPPPLPSATATIDPYPVATATAQATPEFGWESFIPILIQAPGPIR